MLTIDYRVVSVTLTSASPQTELLAEHPSQRREVKIVSKSVLVPITGEQGVSPHYAGEGEGSPTMAEVRGPWDLNKPACQ